MENEKKLDAGQDAELTDQELEQAAGGGIFHRNVVKKLPQWNLPGKKPVVSDLVYREGKQDPPKAEML